jgi:hypothetical protein
MTENDLFMRIAMAEAAAAVKGQPYQDRVFEWQEPEGPPS